MKFNPIRALVLFALIVGFGAFQNCGRAAFKQVGTSESSLIPLSTDDTSVTDTPGGPDVPGTPDSPTPPETPDDDLDDDDRDDKDDDKDEGENKDCKDRDEHKKRKCTKKDCKHGHSKGLVACIVKANGKSVKLGLLTENLSADTSVKQSVCISVKACLELVPAKFEVEGAYDRGYCDKNPHVVQLTDAQIVELLQK